MRRVLLMLLVLLMLPTMVAATAEGTEDKDAIIAELNERIAELEEQIRVLTATPEPTPEPTPAPYSPLKSGSKGDAVVRLQERLKVLGYLGGEADGSYGSGTAGAVRNFQITAGLRETGEADVDTQVALFSEDAPPSPTPVIDETLYEKLDYKANSRDPDAYEGTKFKFSGRILQVLEDSGYAVFRISSKGKYDDVVYCLYVIPENYKRFLEDDDVTVYATSLGIYTYETIMGGTVTLPYCLIDHIQLD